MPAKRGNRGASWRTMPPIGAGRHLPEWGRGGALRSFGVAPNHNLFPLTPTLSRQGRGGRVQTGIILYILNRVHGLHTDTPKKNLRLVPTHSLHPDAQPSILLFPSPTHFPTSPHPSRNCSPLPSAGEGQGEGGLSIVWERPASGPFRPHANPPGEGAEVMEFGDRVFLSRDWFIPPSAGSKGAGPERLPCR